jgi:predicted ArsR family transcriptional regulator
VTAPLLGEGQLDLVVQWAGRRKGVIAPEVAEHFDIPHYAAWRVMQRLVKDGRLFETERKRRRDMLFGADKAGRGAQVYKPRPEQEIHG